MHLYVKAIIEESETALITQRIVKQVWFGLISGLLGSVFGLMGSFATGLGVFEGMVNKYEIKQEKNRKLKDFQRKVYEFKGEFGMVISEQKSNKITPFCTTLGSG